MLLSFIDPCSLGLFSPFPRCSAKLLETRLNNWNSRNELLAKNVLLFWHRDTSAWQRCGFCNTSLPLCGGKTKCATWRRPSQAHLLSNSPATEILSSLASAFSSPVLFGLLNDNLEWYCLEAWRRVKKFLASWQRAGRLHKRHRRCLNQRECGGYEKGPVFSFR